MYPPFVPYGGFGPDKEVSGQLAENGGYSVVIILSWVWNAFANMYNEAASVYPTCWRLNDRVKMNVILDS